MTCLLALVAGCVIGYGVGIWNGTSYLKTELEIIEKRLDSLTKVLMKGKP